MKKPTVSIIIPTCNRPLLLKRAIESVLNQDYENIIEIIVTDDAPNSETKKVVEEFQRKDKRIIYTINEKYKKGPTGNKNNGLDLASGEFIGILDDDDILLPDAISSLIDVYLRKGYKMIFGNCLRSDNKKFSGKHYGKSEEVNYKDILCGKFEGEYWGIFHRDLLGKKRFFDETFGGESLLWWQFYKIQPAFYLHKAVRVYNVENLDKVSKKYFLFPERSFLNYKYALLLFGKDLYNFCKKRFFKILILALFFAKIAKAKKEAKEIIRISFKITQNPLIFLFVFFLILPKNFLIFLYNFYKRKFSFYKG